MSFQKYLLPFVLLLAVVACKPRETLVPEPETVEEGEKEPIPDTRKPASPSLDLTKLYPIRYYSNLHAGEGNYESTLRLENWLSTPAARPDLGRLLPEGGNIHVIAVGGSLTAGVQNGGLYREGQLAAYPNLVARQLGMAGFTSPAFAKSEANGTGFDLLVGNNNPYPHFFQVTNNLAPITSRADGYPPVFNRFNGEVHNFAAPWMSDISSYEWEPWMIGKVVAGSLSGVSWPLHLPYTNRFLPEGASSLLEHLKNDNRYNFFLLEDLNERFINFHRDRNRRPLSLSDLISDVHAGTPLALGSIRFLTTGGKKGVIFTVPQIEHYAYANWETGLQWLGSEQTIYRNAVNTYNNLLKKWAVEYDLALVDLEAIYRQIHEGNFVTDDGVAINGSPRGNFFSSDGIYPTVLGQAVIANEVLKAINSTYLANAPLIPIRAYTREIGMTLE